MKVVNPLSNKEITVNGPLFRKLIKNGFVHEQNKLIKKELSLIENVLLESSPNDLLSLYLTDSYLKNILNQEAILKLLSTKYNVKAKNFIQFFKAYNIKTVDLRQYKTLYMYQLENKLYIPKIIIKDRIVILKWAHTVSAKLNLNHRVFGLAVTLFDAYPVNSKAVALICLYISSYMLTEYVDVKDYLKQLKITKTEFNKIQRDIITTMNGLLIRPSTVFFTDNVDLTILSYFSNELLKYKPSLIAEAINYITTGEYKIYTLTEFSNPCKILHKLTTMNTYKCVDKNKIIQHEIIKKPNLWHIGNYDKLNMIGEGAEGVIYKIKNINKYYVLKSVQNNLEPVSVEISVMKQLINPYIVQIHAFKLMPRKNNLYLDMGEFNLYDGIVNNKLPKSKFWFYIKNIVRAVDYCHYNDIIHRDLKPENIVYDGTKLKLIDFGLSVPYSSFHDELDPDMACTLNYRAPEALLGDTHYNYKIDIWSIGLIIFFMNKKYDLFNKKPDIFQTFGSPLASWPEVTKLPLWKKTTFKKKSIKMNQYTEIFEMCTVLNPLKRAKTSTLLTYIELKL